MRWIIKSKECLLRINRDLFLFSLELNSFTEIDRLSSQVIFHDVQSWRLFSKVLDDNARASANLSWLAFLVDFAQTAPFAQFLAAVDADQRDLMFAAQSSDQLFVLWLVAAFSENTEDGLTSRKRTQCHWLLFARKVIKQRDFIPRQLDWASDDEQNLQICISIKAKVSKSSFSYLTLTCPKLCKLGGFHEPIHRRRAISWGLLAMQCSNPWFRPWQLLVHWLH